MSFNLQEEKCRVCAEAAYNTKKSLETKFKTFVTSVKNFDFFQVFKIETRNLRLICT